MTFGDALEIIKRGGKVARTGWNGKGMFLFLVHPVTIEYKADIPDAEIEFLNEIPNSIAMATAENKIIVGWLASQTDMLSDDWIKL